MICSELDQFFRLHRLSDEEFHLSLTFQADFLVIYWKHPDVKQACMFCIYCILLILVLPWLWQGRFHVIIGHWKILVQGFLANWRFISSSIYSVSVSLFCIYETGVREADHRQQPGLPKTVGQPDIAAPYLKLSFWCTSVSRQSGRWTVYLW